MFMHRDHHRYFSNHGKGGRELSGHIPSIDEAKDNSITTAVQLTKTTSSVKVQLKAFLTSTSKAAWCIDAKLTALSISKSTLIYVLGRRNEQ